MAQLPTKPTQQLMHHLALHAGYGHGGAGCHVGIGGEYDQGIWVGGVNLGFGSGGHSGGDPWAAHSGGAGGSVFPSGVISARDHPLAPLLPFAAEAGVVGERLTAPFDIQGAWVLRNLSQHCLALNIYCAYNIQYI